MLKCPKFRYVFALYAAVVSYVCVFMMYPTHDDWNYAAPHPNMNLLTRLMPGAVMWRPFDRLFEYLLGYVPSLFPYVNHVVSMAGHFALCLVLYALLKRLTHNRTGACLGTLCFCLSPGIVITITNSDFMNQIWAMVTGITAAFFFFRARLSGRLRYYVLWLLFAFVSVLVKENGIVWFIAPAMLYSVYSFMNGGRLTDTVKANFVYFLIGAAGIIVYFCIRFSLLGDIVLGEPTSEQRYMLNFSPLHIIRNYSLMIGGAVTSIDTLAVFLKPRNYPVIFITGMISVAFLCVILACVYNIFKTNRKLFYSLIGLFVCAGFISSPYAVMGYNAESTAYEMAFMFGIIFGIILSSCRWPRKSSAVLVLMFVSMILVLGHKFYVMHNYTRSVYDFIAEHSSEFVNIPQKVHIYFIEDVPMEGYSTYTYPIGHGLGRGKAFNSVWNWKADFTVKTVSSDADIDFTPASLSEYDTVFSLTRSGTLKVLKN